MRKAAAVLAVLCGLAACGSNATNATGDPDETAHTVDQRGDEADGDDAGTDTIDTSELSPTARSVLVVTLQQVGDAETELDVEDMINRFESALRLGDAQSEITVQGGAVTIRVEGDPDADFDPLVEQIRTLAEDSRVALRPVLQCVAAPADVRSAPTSVTPVPSDPNTQQVLPLRDGGQCLVGPAGGNGSVFEAARAEIIQGGWGVTADLRPGAGGVEVWNRLAAQCYVGDEACPSRQLAIEVDGEIVSAPSVNQPSFSGSVQITGSFREAEASELAEVLNAGTATEVLRMQSVSVTRPTGVTVDTETDEATEPETGFVYGSGNCPELGGSPLPDAFADAPAKCIEAGHRYTAEVVTSVGSFRIELAADRSPGTVNNFVVLARYHYYDGTSCHRIIADFVVQCGRPGADETAPGYTIPDELPEPGEYAEGVVAMANAGPDTGGGQWFVIVGPNGAALPPDYPILGTVTDDGAATLQALERMADPRAANGVPPRGAVEIVSVTIVEAA